MPVYESRKKPGRYRVVRWIDGKRFETTASSRAEAEQKERDLNLAHPRTVFPETFWNKVDKSGGPDACWTWTGGISDDGYGTITKPGVGTVKAHRVAYELANGTIPDGLCVCHRCDVPACVNAAHLFLGTQAENLADMRAKGRAPWQKRTGS